MAKTYIYGPQELNFAGNRDNPGELNAEIDSDITNNVKVGDVVEFDGDQFIVYSTHDELEGNIIKATRSGMSPYTESGVGDYIINEDYININTGLILIQFANESDRPEPDSYTFGVYKGASSGLPGLENKNVVYEYQMLAQSNMKDICLALKELRAALDSETDYPENPGYSVTKDMANTLKDIVVAKGGEVEAKEYFNDLEAIADYIKILAFMEAAEATPSS